MMDLFSELSVDLGEKMSYPYPSKVERKVKEYCLNICHGE